MSAPGACWCGASHPNGMIHPPQTCHVACLHCAWAEAEAALPEGWLLSALRQGDLRDGWYAEASNDSGIGRYAQQGFGPTPTAALQALAQRLREAGG